MKNLPEMSNYKIENRKENNWKRNTARITLFDIFLATNKAF